ncbi:prostaglandin reductase 1-like [Chrysoperla carnea]|uniref:prostaglandin reductase 1-like n=1 Tax=Chrysoperla carnea TaxID=189513 RepID=UPI001D0986A3|nr:prostaglandin reductase 1-like [Chrysoperla carnea]
MVKARRYVYKTAFDGEPKKTDLEIVEEELRPIKDGEFLCKAVYLSVDPYMRAYMSRYETGVTMIGGQVAEVIESKHKKYPVGRYVVGYFGWVDHVISDGKVQFSGAVTEVYLLPDFGKLPVSLGLGVLGMPGQTAYFGFLELCQPKENETVVVSGAAGAVGSLVGQIAKIKKCHVVGIAGSDEKCKWLIDEIGFDRAINYKTANFEKQLQNAAPKGVDCYFDNVGGEISSTIIKNMNYRGRISVCGSISSYNDTHNNLSKATVIQPFMIFKQLRMEGFIVHRWADRFGESTKEYLKWISEGKIKYRETVTNGFENMFEAFVGMLKGKNIGKAVVRAFPK